MLIRQRGSRPRWPPSTSRPCSRSPSSRSSAALSQPAKLSQAHARLFPNLIEEGAADPQSALAPRSRRANDVRASAGDRRHVCRSGVWQLALARARSARRWQCTRARCRSIASAREPHVAGDFGFCVGRAGRVVSHARGAARARRRGRDRARAIALFAPGHASALSAQPDRPRWPARDRKRAVAARDPRPVEQHARRRSHQRRARRSGDG